MGSCLLIAVAYRLVKVTEQPRTFGDLMVARRRLWTTSLNEGVKGPEPEQQRSVSPMLSVRLERSVSGVVIVCECSE